MIVAVGTIFEKLGARPKQKRYEMIARIHPTSAKAPFLELFEKPLTVQKLAMASAKSMTSSHTSSGFVITLCRTTINFRLPSAPRRDGTMYYQPSKTASSACCAERPLTSGLPSAPRRDGTMYYQPSKTASAPERRPTSGLPSAPRGDGIMYYQPPKIML